MYTMTRGANSHTSLFEGEITAPILLLIIITTFAFYHLVMTTSDFSSSCPPVSTNSTSGGSINTSSIPLGNSKISSQLVINILDTGSI